MRFPQERTYEDTGPMAPPCGEFVFVREAKTRRNRCLGTPPKVRAGDLQGTLMSREYAECDRMFVQRTTPAPTPCT